MKKWMVLALAFSVSGMAWGSDSADEPVIWDRGVAAKPSVARDFSLGNTQDPPTVKKPVQHESFTAKGGGEVPEVFPNALPKAPAPPKEPVSVDRVQDEHRKPVPQESLPKEQGKVLPKPSTEVVPEKSPAAQATVSATGSQDMRVEPIPQESLPKERAKMVPKSSARAVPRNPPSAEVSSSDDSAWEKWLDWPMSQESWMQDGSMPLRNEIAGDRPRTEEPVSMVASRETRRPPMPQDGLTGKAPAFSATDGLQDSQMESESPKRGAEEGGGSTPALATDQVPAIVPLAEKPASTDSLREERLWHRLEAAQKRADEAEAALAKIRKTKSLGAKDDDDGSAAAMERRPRLSVQGGGGEDKAINVEAKLIQPLWSSPFDLSLRGYYQTVDYVVEKSRKERYSTTSYHYTYHSGYRYSGGHRYHYSYYTSEPYTTWHTRTVYYDETETMESYGCDVALVFRPFRGKIFSPYAGVGGSFDGAVPEDADALLFAWRAGGTLNLGKVWLNGMCSVRKSNTDVSAEIGYRCSRYLALNACLAWFITDGDAGDGFTGGGGLTFVF